MSISRTRRGLLPFAAPGKDHVAHRLANLGLGQKGAVVTSYLLGAVAGGLALLFVYLRTGMALISLSVLAVMLMGAVVLLERAPYERQVK